MALLMVAASSLCAGIPMFSFLAIIWWMDRYDREPVWLLLLTFLWGAIGSVILSLFLTVFWTAVVGVGLAFIDSPEWAFEAALPSVIAPLAEEPAKALVLLLVIWHADFDNMTDGFVYGAAAGLGFGMTENFLYFVSSIDDIEVWISTIIIRTCYSAIMHATATAVIGAALGWARFRGLLTLLFAGIFGLFAAICIHGLWNGLLTFDAILDRSGQLVSLDFLILFVEAVLVLVAFQVCLFDESAHIKRELTLEVESGLIPAGHPAILASWFQRNRGGWLRAGVDQNRYVEAATNLAMRKRQLRQMGTRAPPFYVAEVERLRHEIDLVLASAA